MGNISQALYLLKKNTSQPAAFQTNASAVSLNSIGSVFLNALKSSLSLFMNNSKPERQSVVSVGDRARTVQQLELAFDFFRQGFEVSDCVDNL